MTASELLALALGESSTGPNRCFYCGASCGGLNSRKQHVKDTFTDLSACVCPDSQFVCKGCVLSMREKVDMPGRDKPQKMRTYSWVITSSEAKPYTKADIAALRSVCLSPPAPPYAIALATSGQKHVIFKTPVCVDPTRVVVCMEGEVIDYAPGDMADRMALVTRIIAVTGKPPMSSAPDMSMAMRLHDARGDAGLRDYETWDQIWSQPLSRLAVFLAPSKLEAQSDSSEA